MKKGIEQYESYLGDRYQTFLYAFEAFIAMAGKTIVELGTSRSFVSAGFPGCMSNDSQFWQPCDPSQWDWGAGIFTKMAAMHLEAHRPEIHSVDISRDAINISKLITSEFQEFIVYYWMSSERFLKGVEGQIDFLYMDTGETSSDAEQLHLREAKIAIERNLFSERALVLVDDVNIPGETKSKGRLSIPFLCKHGFEIKKVGYQVLMQKSAK